MDRKAFLCLLALVVSVLFLFAHVSFADITNCDRNPDICKNPIPTSDSNLGSTSNDPDSGLRSATFSCDASGGIFGGTTADCERAFNLSGLGQVYEVDYVNTRQDSPPVKVYLCINNTGTMGNGYCVTVQEFAPKGSLTFAPLSGLDTSQYRYMVIHARAESSFTNDNNFTGLFTMYRRYVRITSFTPSAQTISPGSPAVVNWAAQFTTPASERQLLITHPDGGVSSVDPGNIPESSPSYSVNLQDTSVGNYVLTLRFGGPSETDGDPLGFTRAQSSVTVAVTSGPTHKECSHSSCTSVSGAGGDQCNTDSDCSPGAAPAPGPAPSPSPTPVPNPGPGLGTVCVSVSGHNVDTNDAYFVSGPDQAWGWNGPKCFSGHIPGSYSVSAPGGTTSPSGANLAAGGTVTFAVTFGGSGGGPPPPPSLPPQGVGTVCVKTDTSARGYIISGPDQTWGWNGDKCFGNRVTGNYSVSSDPGIPVCPPSGVLASGSTLNFRVNLGTCSVTPPSSSPPTTHGECQSGSCVQVLGSGGGCSLDRECRHNVCSSDGACVQVLSPGPSNSCANAGDPDAPECPQPPPSCTFSASPDRVVVPPPHRVTLSWNCRKAHFGCTISPGVGSVGQSGNASVSVSQDTNYTLSCSGRGGSGSWNATVRAFEYSGGKLKEVAP